jgi:hypothetical protein
LHTEAYADIKRLRPQRVVFCTTLEHPDALQLLTMLRLDSATRGIAVLTVTPYGPHECGGLNAGPATASDPESEWGQSGIGSNELDGDRWNLTVPLRPYASRFEDGGVIAAARPALIFMVTGCATDPVGMASAASISVAACSSAAHQTRTWPESSPRALPMRVCRASNVSRLRSTL